MQNDENIKQDDLSLEDMVKATLEEIKTIAEGGEVDCSKLCKAMFGEGNDLKALFRLLSKNEKTDADIESLSVKSGANPSELVQGGMQDSG